MHRGARRACGPAVTLAALVALLGAAPGPPAGGAAPAAPPAADTLEAAAPIPIVTIVHVDSLLTAARGRWALLNIWATWCRPCVAETPDLVALYRAVPAGRLALFGLSTDLMIEPTAAAARAKLVAFRGEHRIPYPLLLYFGTNDNLVDRFALGGAIPVTILYDPAGQVAGRWEKRLGKADLARIRSLVR